MSERKIAFLEDYIKNGQVDNFSIGKFYETILTSNADTPDHICRIAIDDFFIKHRKELSNIIIFKKVPDEMFYKPKLFSFMIYGTTEMWLSILRVNRMRNVTEFCKSVIAIYEPNQLKQLMNLYFKRDNTLIQ